jgi:hypothetical protein
MDGGNEQRDAIKFCFKVGLSATETLVLLQKADRNEAVNGSNVFRRYSRFTDRRELVEDEERGGRQKSTHTEVNIAAVADLVKTYRRIASRIIVQSLNIPMTLVRPAEFCSREFFVLHDNTPAHQAAGVCQFFTQKNVTITYHPPCYSDLSPPDYFVFPKLKMKLK